MEVFVMDRVRPILVLWALALAASAGLFVGADRVMAQTGCSGFQIGTTTAAPDPVAAGGTETIITQVCSGSAASNINIYLEIDSQSVQRIFSGQNFAAGQTKSFRWDYAVSPALQPGLHMV